MKFKFFTVGNPGAPVAGDTKFYSEFLKECIVSHIHLNNDIENQQNPSPDFVHNYVDGYIDRSPNQYKAGDKLTIFYKKCKCN